MLAVGASAALTFLAVVPAVAASPPSAAAPKVINPATGAGATTVGTAVYPVPAGAVFVSQEGSDNNPGTQSAPLRTVAAALGRTPQNGTVVLRAGVYHESIFVTDSKSVTVQAYPNEGVWFDGSVPVTGWIQHGSTWVHSGWTATFDHSASFTTGGYDSRFIDPKYPMAAYPDQMFSNGVQLAQVAVGQLPKAGEFAVDPGQQTLTVGSDPTGHNIRSSDLVQAFLVAGRATLRGFGVRRYATPLPRMGAVFLGGSGSGSQLQNLVIDNNATQGLSIDQPRTVADHLTVSNNGMTGIHGNYLDGSTIAHCLMFGNDRENFNTWPSSGDIKVTQSAGVTITGNDVSSARPLGIWTDMGVTNAVIVRNYVHGATEYGVLIEKSSTVVVAGNVVRNAKRGATVLDTQNSRVYNNLFGDNTLWDFGVQQDGDRSGNAANPYLSRNVMVVDNIFADRTQAEPETVQFYALDYQSHIPADSMNITITGNLFAQRMVSTDPSAVGWGGSDNYTVQTYDDPATLARDKGLHWANLVVATRATSSYSGQSAGSVTIPPDIAAEIGAATGSEQLGPVA